MFSATTEERRRGSEVLPGATGYTLGQLVGMPCGWAAAVGALAGAVLVLGRRTIFEHGWLPERAKLAILLATLALLWRFRKLPEPILVLGAAVIGMVIYPWIHA